MRQQEIAELVRRNCLTFAPTERDRQDLRRLGAADGGAGTVTLKPDQAGTTSLAVIANGIRQYLTLTVLPRGAREPADCP